MTLPSNISKPLLKYPGSKFRIAGWIIDHFPPHQIYVEPFGGSAAVLFQKSPSKVEVYNDIEKEVVNVFRVLRDPDKRKRLIDNIYFTPYARDEHDELFELTGDEVEDARRFIVRGIMNIAKGPYQKSGFDTRVNDDFFVSRLNFFKDYPFMLTAFTERLKNVIIENRSYEKIITQFDRPETLFYCDPEYLDTGAVYPPDFYYEDHENLADLILSIEGMAIISGYDSELYRKKFEAKGWVKKRCKAYADGGYRRTECIWMNPATVKNQRQGDLFT